ncbi:MAG: hypothetical protein AAF408_13980 [Pseudomonadota bacterium]
MSNVSANIKNYLLLQFHCKAQHAHIQALQTLWGKPPDYSPLRSVGHVRKFTETLRETPYHSQVSATVQAVYLPETGYFSPWFRAGSGRGEEDRHAHSYIYFHFDIRTACHRGKSNGTDHRQ